MIKSNSLHSRSTTKESLRMAENAQSHEMVPQIQTYINSNESATYGRFPHISRSNSGFVFITESPSFLGTDSVLYSEERHSERSDISELSDHELEKQYDASNEKNTDRTHNEHNVVTKDTNDDTQYIKSDIDESQKEITAQIQNAPPPLVDVSLDSRSEVESIGAQFGQPIRPIFIPSLPTIRSGGSISLNSISDNNHNIIKLYSPSITKDTPALKDFSNSNRSTTNAAFSCISISETATQTTFPPLPPRRSAQLKGTFQNESGDFKSFQYGEYLEYWREGHNNSVSPKYKDLGEEMMINNVARITVEQYDELHSKAQKLMAKRPLLAKRVGNNNRICGIKEGSPPSTEHIVALLIYTNFIYHQREFKRHCRRLSANESLQDLVDKNREIYHWSKLIKELCIFYGEIMDENAVLYSGMGECLMFDSLCTRFECPISTSTKFDVAKRFAKGAVVLKFKRGSANTKVLDVTEYSCFGKDESQRLVAGSTLRIIDILINNKSHETYVSALRMFEQIMNGHFIIGDDNVTSKLVSLLRYAVSPTLTDKLQLLNLTDSFYIFLEDQCYDSDSVMEDIAEDTSSVIAKRFDPSLFAQVQKRCSDHAGTWWERMKHSISSIRSLRGLKFSLKPQSSFFLVLL